MLLVECNVLEKVEVINEGTEGNTRLRLRGKFQQCDEQNNNGRIYPRKILESQVKAIQEKIGDRSLVGALDHPANDAIHLSQASHLITGLNIGKDGSVIGECEILSTPNGKIVEALINDGVKIGISSRGVGSVTEGIKGKIVNEDFKLITFDLVSDPSTRGAFPELSESMRENSERAQQIVSKHKKDRVLLTMLESKISEALKGKQKKLDKNKNNKIDSEDFKMLRGEKRADEKSFPDLNKDGKITFADILKGRLKGGEDDEEDKKPAKKTDKKEDAAKKANEAVIEALKKVCWGDRYDEGSIKNDPDKFKAAQAAYKGMSADDVINTPVYPKKKRTPDNTTAETELAKMRRKGPVTMKPKRAHSNVRRQQASTDIFGQKVVEAYRNLVRKDEYTGQGVMKAAQKKAQPGSSEEHAAVARGRKETDVMRQKRLDPKTGKPVQGTTVLRKGVTRFIRDK
jgi:hypothetical protein